LSDNLGALAAGAFLIKTGKSVPMNFQVEANGRRLKKPFLNVGNRIGTEPVE
jgi:hypothetical protein